jgi:predicted metal-dependent HD superfamily phosphohydrolase
VLQLNPNSDAAIHRYLHETWFEMWRELAPDISNTWIIRHFNELTATYGSMERHYHDLSHIAYFLKMLESYRGFIKVYPELQLAAFTHDKVIHFAWQPPGLPSDEIQSALYADELMRQVRIGKESRQRIVRLIIATEHTYNYPVTPDEELFVDIDWSPMGLLWEQFKENGKKIRKEHAAISDDAFREGRLKFLRSALKRPSQFHTDVFRDRYEAQAIKNIKRAIKELE